MLNAQDSLRALLLRFPGPWAPGGAGSLLLFAGVVLLVLALFVGNRTSEGEGGVEGDGDYDVEGGDGGGSSGDGGEDEEESVKQLCSPEFSEEKASSGWYASLLAKSVLWRHPLKGGAGRPGARDLEPPGVEGREGGLLMGGEEEGLLCSDSEEGLARISLWASLRQPSRRAQLPIEARDAREGQEGRHTITRALSAVLAPAVYQSAGHTALSSPIMRRHSQPGRTSRPKTRGQKQLGKETKPRRAKKKHYAPPSMEQDLFQEPDSPCAKSSPPQAPPSLRQAGLSVALSPEDGPNVDRQAFPGCTVSPHPPSGRPSELVLLPQGVVVDEKVAERILLFLLQVGPTKHLCSIREESDGELEGESDNEGDGDCGSSSITTTSSSSSGCMEASGDCWDQKVTGSVGIWSENSLNMPGGVSVGAQGEDKGGGACRKAREPRAMDWDAEEVLRVGPDEVPLTRELLWAALAQLHRERSMTCAATGAGEGEPVLAPAEAAGSFRPGAGAAREDVDFPRTQGACGSRESQDLEKKQHGSGKHHMPKDAEVEGVIT